jgi:hypothetical protein
MARPAGGYKNEANVRVIGTTTVTGRFKDGTALNFWAYKKGKEDGLAGRVDAKLYDSVEKAADIGTVVHEMCEMHIGGAIHEAIMFHAQQTLGEDFKHAQSGFGAYLSWERQSGLKVVEQEMPLVSEEYQFGGTPDAIGELEGELCLLDWKTSNSVYPEMLIQLAAYKHLYEVNRDRELTGGFHLLRFSKELAHHFYPDLSNAWRMFVLLREAYEIDKELKARTK